MNKGGESTANLLSRTYGSRKKGEKNEEKRRVSLTRDSNRRLPANEKPFCGISYKVDPFYFTGYVRQYSLPKKTSEFLEKLSLHRETASVKQGRPHKAVLNEPQNPAAGMCIPGTQIVPRQQNNN
jgi:hypothetical protein